MFPELNAQHIETIQIALRGRKATERLVSYCEEKNIASRATVYAAINPEKFNGKSLYHKAVGAAALVFLKEYFDITFDWPSHTEAA